MTSAGDGSDSPMAGEQGRPTAFLDREGRLRLRWRVALFLCGFAGVQLVLGILAGLGLVAFVAATEGLSSKALESAIDDPSALLSAQIVTAPMFLVAVGLLVALCRRFVDRRSVGSLGLGQPQGGWLATILYGTGLGSVPILMVVALLFGLGAVRLDGVTTSWQTWALVPTLLVMAFLEELVFRGYLLGNFVEARKVRFGVVFSSFLFWMSHALNPAAWSSPLVPLNLFGAGVVLALAFLVSGNLWFPTLVHFAWNLTQGVLFELPVSGLQTDGLLDVEATGGSPMWLAGGSFGLEASVLLTLSEVGLVLGLLWRLRRRGSELS
jgi:membrane protease YdiL (CAAX protease family)